ncbi:MAG: diguanylate cyclase [Anaerolineaceae bacterium]|nr:diguanylate cyclase [Anaerolineaceae bacterium]
MDKKKISGDLIVSTKDRRAKRTIFLLEHDQDQAENLQSQIGYFGYLVEHFLNLEALKKRIKVLLPAALLVDVDFQNINEEDRSKLLEIIGSLSSELSIFYISKNQSATARLMAVRAGGKAYFTKPVDIGVLIDALDQLTVHENPEPIRVLIVEDSIFQASVVSKKLQKADMITDIVTRPKDLVDRLYDFKPDLILLDINMPECTGIELAAIIRQMEDFVSVPIVYHTSEKDRDMRFEAMKLGGDDFLSKDTQTDHLIMAVIARVNRYRKLRSLMTRDSLTGLLNHTAIKGRLVQEVARAKRLNQTLSFVMLDLDKFKLVNDTYGHLSGDKVLKSISRFLTQRLRSTDLIGRYGGEEFALILPDTELAATQQLMEDLRKLFEKIPHNIEKHTFHVTFSCGIACYPDIDDAILLNDTADKALYEAKRLGRNQVFVIQPED